MEDGDKDINNKSSSAEIVKRIITLITDPVLQELFSAINKNPSLVRELNSEEIKTIILDILSTMMNKEKMQNSLEGLLSLEKNFSLFKDVVNDIARHYNECSPDNPAVFRVEPQKNILPQTNITTKPTHNAPHEILPIKTVDPTDITVGDILTCKVSDLVNENILDYKSKLAIADIFLRFMLIDILKYTPPAIKNFLAGLKEQQLQYKICKDFIDLKNREKELLSQSILEKYVERSMFLSGMLKENKVPDSEYILLHRNILDGLVEAYQEEKESESTFYYLSGIRDDATIAVDFNCFGSINDLTEDPNLQQEIFEFNAKNQSFSEELKKIHNQELKQEMTDKHNEKRVELTRDIKPYIDKMLSHRKFEIMDLLPEQRRNYPASFIEPNKGLAIPIAVAGIDKDLKREIYHKLFLGSTPDSDIPKCFDVGYLIRGSSIKIQNNAVDISQGYTAPGDIYPVLLYNEVAIILKDFTQLKNIAADTQAFDEDVPDDPNTFKEIFNMFYAMIENNNQKNIYDELTNRTRSSIRTEYKSKYK